MWSGGRFVAEGCGGGGQRGLAQRRCCRRSSGRRWVQLRSQLALASMRATQKKLRLHLLTCMCPPLPCPRAPARPAGRWWFSTARTAASWTAIRAWPAAAAPRSSRRRCRCVQPGRVGDALRLLWPHSRPEVGLLTSQCRGDHAACALCPLPVSGCPAPAQTATTPPPAPQGQARSLSQSIAALGSAVKADVEQVRARGRLRC